MAEDELKLRLGLENLQYKKAWADVRVQTARDLAQIKASVTNNLNQARQSAAQSVAGIRTATATQLGQTRVNTAQQLAQIRVNTAAQLNQIRNNAARSLGQMGSQFESAGRRMSVGLTLPLAALAAAAVRSARDIDAQVNTLRAFTGSAEAAEKRLAQLIATSRQTPGLTTALALQLDAQLRVAQATEQTIDRILPAVGRLNAVQRIEDPARFTQNLVQLVTQNFERRDLKELIGASPLAGQVIRELFNVDSPINSQAIRESAKKMGIRTVDEFFAAFADAAARNKGLQNVTESIGTAFDKMADRVNVALRPLGLAIIGAFKPILDAALPAVEALGKAFNDLPTPVKTSIVVLGGFAAAIGPVLFITGSLISTIGTLQKAYVTLNALALIPTRANLQLLGQVMQGTASLTAGAGATTAVAAGGWVALGAAILAAAAASVVLARAVDSALEGKGTTEGGRRLGGILRATLEVAAPLYGLSKALGLVGGETKKLADAQEGALPPLRNFAEGVEEETESLKALKRALEEVELAGRSRVAAAQRDYNEERTTLAEFTAAQIAALYEELDAKTAITLTGRLERLKQLQEASAGPISPELEKRLKDEISGLELESKKAFQETLDAIADLQSEARIKEKESEERHRDNLLSVQRINAERQVDVLRDAAERNEELKLDSERKIVEIERRITFAEIAEVRRRLAATTAGTEERLNLEDELASKVAQRQRQRAEQARRLARAELEAALLPIRREGLKEDARGAGDTGVAARLRSIAELGRTSFESTEAQIGKILDAGFARRIQNLKDEIAVRTKHNQDVSALNAQLAQLEQERVNVQEEADRATQAGRLQDLDRAQDYKDRLRDIYGSVANAALKARQVAADVARRLIEVRRPLNLQERREQIEHQTNLAHAEAAIVHARNAGEIQDEIDRLNRKKELNAQEVEQLRALHEALKAEDERYRLETESIEVGRTEALQDPSVLDPMKNAIQSLKDSALAAWGAMAQGFGQMVSNWILTGKLGEGGIRKLVASVISSFAQMAAVQALMELAYGVAALTPWGAAIYGPAPPHFKAAALLGAAAALAAVVGRAVAAGGSTGAAGALADSGGAAGSERESERLRREREQAEQDKFTRREDRRGEDVRFLAPVILNLDGREIARNHLEIVRGHGDLRDGYQRTLLGYS